MHTILSYFLLFFIGALVGLNLHKVKPSYSSVLVLIAFALIISLIFGLIFNAE